MNEREARGHHRKPRQYVLAEFTVDHVVLVFPLLVGAPVVWPQDHFCAVPLFGVPDIQNQSIGHTLDNERHLEQYLSKRILTYVAVTSAYSHLHVYL